MDDMLIFGKDQVEHEEQLEEVLKWTESAEP